MDQDNNNNSYGMSTRIWGPHMWEILHIITFCYPESPSNEDKEKYKNFFILIGDILPCESCRISYKHFIKHNYLLCSLSF